jgi:hypothetical protein
VAPERLAQVVDTQELPVPKAYIAEPQEPA